MWTQYEKNSGKKNASRTDATDPNLCKWGIIIYFYQEKKMIDLLRQKEISESEYQELDLLTQLETYPIYCIAKEIWSNVPHGNYEEFSAQKDNLQLRLQEHLDDLQKTAEFVYQTAERTRFYLPKKETDHLGQEFKKSLREICKDKPYFYSEDLAKIYQDNAQKMDKFSPRIPLSAAQRQQEQDEPEGATLCWSDMDSYRIYEASEQCNKKDIPAIEQLIVKIRFLTEFNNITQIEKLEKDLKKQLFSKAVKLYGMTLLNQKNNSFSQEAIEQELKAQLFDESKNSSGNVSALIRNGADLNTLDKTGRSVLGHALAFNTLPNKIVRQLLDLNVDVNLKHDSRKETTLMLAVKAKNFDTSLFERIIAQSTTFNNQNMEGKTALHIAIEINNKIAIQWLLLRTDLHLKDNQGNTPLIIAAKQDQPQIVKLMLNQQPDTINLQNHDGDSALMVALQAWRFRKETLTIIDDLILAGANLNLINKKGKNASQLAEKDKDANQQFNKSLQQLANQKTLNLKKYAYYDKVNQQFYASPLWLELIEILVPDQSHLFKEQYQDKIPLDVMVSYTQDNFLRKRDGRWLLENYSDLNPKIKERLDSLLRDYGLVNEQELPQEVGFALFLGTSTANLCKRAFYLYDAIVKNQVNIQAVIVLGNTEPYDKFIDSIKTIISLYPAYFREGLTAQDVPTHASMHETMLFVVNNLNWPVGKQPRIIPLVQNHPCNTNDEVSAVTTYLSSLSEKRNLTNHPAFFPQANPKSTVMALSHQPFNDRQGITALGGFKKTGLENEFHITVAGPGVETYPLLNTLPASAMNSPQIVDNLTRTLYEIKQNAHVLFISHKQVDSANDIVKTL